MEKNLNITSQQINYTAQNTSMSTFKSYVHTLYLSRPLENSSIIPTLQAGLKKWYLNFLHEYACGKFPQLSKTKLKKEILIQPDIRKSSNIEANDLLQMMTTSSSKPTSSITNLYLLRRCKKDLFNIFYTKYSKEVIQFLMFV